MSALHCLTSPLLHSCIEPDSFVLVDWFIASFFHRFDPVIHRFSFIEHSFGFMFAFINWFIGSPATYRGISIESMIHCSTDSDSLIRCCTIDRPTAMGHRATGPPGHRANKPPGHQTRATASHKPPAIGPRPLGHWATGPPATQKFNLRGIDRNPGLAPTPLPD